MARKEQKSVGIWVVSTQCLTTLGVKLADKGRERLIDVMGMCVCERERGRDRQTDRDREEEATEMSWRCQRDRDKEKVIDVMGMSKRERERFIERCN